MSATVPEQRIALDDTAIRIGNTVRAVSWVHPPRLNNWVAGRGRQLVPAHAPMSTIAAGASSEFHYRIRPSYPAVRLRYSILLTAETEAGASIDIPPGTNRPPGVIVQNRRRAVPLTYDIDLASQADDEIEAEIKITASVSSVVVESISIEAIPRVFLVSEDPNDMGADRLLFWHRRPISERNFHRHLYQFQSELKRSARRDPFNHSFGSDDPWDSGGAAGPVDIFDGTIGMLGRYLYSGETTREIHWRVRAYCSDGTTAGEVALTNTGAGSASSTITIPAGTTNAIWLPVTTGDAANFDCNAEDTAHAVGLRGSAVDEHSFKVTRTAGSGTIYVESISSWEPPDAAPPPPTNFRITDAGDPRITDGGDVRITD